MQISDRKGLGPQKKLLISYNYLKIQILGMNPALKMGGHRRASKAH